MAQHRNLDRSAKAPPPAPEFCLILDPQSQLIFGPLPWQTMPRLCPEKATDADVGFRSASRIRHAHPC